MFKAALIATVAVATQEFQYGVDGTFPDPPADGETMTFVPYEPTNIKVPGMFTLDMSQTVASPDPPHTATTENFTIAGISKMPMTVAGVRFQCWLYGAPAYNESFAPDAGNENITPGTEWKQSIPFDVPGVAPKTTYDIQVCAEDSTQTPLFCMRTAFKFE